MQWIAHDRAREPQLYLDDRVKSEHRSRVLGVGRERHSTVGGDAEVLARRHVPEAHLLFPADHVACITTSRPHSRHCKLTYPSVAGSVAGWLACWTQAQKGPGSNRSRYAVG